MGMITPHVKQNGLGVPNPDFVLAPCNNIPGKRLGLASDRRVEPPENLLCSCE